MTYKGHVQNGVIVVEGAVALPEGAEVRIEFMDEGKKAEPDEQYDFRKHYAAVIGKAEGLPKDAALNHDHYLCGAPKK